MMKHYAHIVSVYVLVKIKQVHFKLLVHPVNSWPFANIGNAGQLAQLFRTQGHRVHTAQRYGRSIQTNVCGWKSNSAAAFITVCNPSANAIGVTQHHLGIVQTVLLQRLPDTGTADAHIIHAVGG